MKLFILQVLLIFAGHVFLNAQNFSETPNLSDTSKTSYQKVGVVDNLPVFYTKLADRLTFPMSWLSGNYHDFAEWREIARQKLKESLIYDPPPVPFDPLVLEEEDRGNYVAKRIIINISADSRILCYVLEPKGDGPFPTALLLHDHGARFDIGKEKVVRPFDEDLEE